MVFFPLGGGGTDMGKLMGTSLPSSSKTNRLPRMLNFPFHPQISRVTGVSSSHRNSITVDSLSPMTPVSGIKSNADFSSRPAAPAFGKYAHNANRNAANRFIFKRVGKARRCAACRLHQSKPDSNFCLERASRNAFPTKHDFRRVQSLSYRVCTLIKQGAPVGAET